MKKCPFCAEEIQDEAIKCRYCGESLDKNAGKPHNKPDTDVLSPQYQQKNADVIAGKKGPSLTEGIVTIAMIAVIIVSTQIGDIKKAFKFYFSDTSSHISQRTKVSPQLAAQEKAPLKKAAPTGRPTHVSCEDLYTQAFTEIEGLCGPKSSRSTASRSVVNRVSEKWKKIFDKNKCGMSVFQTYGTWEKPPPVGGPGVLGVVAKSALLHCPYSSQYDYTDFYLQLQVIK